MRELYLSTVLNVSRPSLAASEALILSERSKSEEGEEAGVCPRRFSMESFMLLLASLSLSFLVAALIGLALLLRRWARAAACSLMTIRERATPQPLCTPEQPGLQEQLRISFPREVLR